MHQPQRHCAAIHAQVLDHAKTSTKFYFLRGACRMSIGTELLPGAGCRLSLLVPCIPRLEHLLRMLFMMLVDLTPCRAGTVASMCNLPTTACILFGKAFPGHREHSRQVRLPRRGKLPHYRPGHEVFRFLDCQINLALSSCLSTGGFKY